LGMVGAASEILTGSTAGDLILANRSGQEIILSADAGNAQHHLRILETGVSYFLKNTNFAEGIDVTGNMTLTSGTLLLAGNGIGNTAGILTFATGATGASTFGGAIYLNDNQLMRWGSAADDPAMAGGTAANTSRLQRADTPANTYYIDGHGHTTETGNIGHSASSTATQATAHERQSSKYQYWRTSHTLTYTSGLRRYVEISNLNHEIITPYQDLGIKVSQNMSYITKLEIRMVQMQRKMNKMEKVILENDIVI